jgi:nickel transport protein
MTWIRVFFACALLGFFTESAAHAHHLWVVKTDDSYGVARGLLPEPLDPYKPECVKAFVAVGPDGAMIPSEKLERIDEAEGVRFRTAEDVSLVGVTCDWGYRVNTTQGKKLLRRQEAEKAGFRVVDSFFSTQYAKVLFKEGAGNTKPIGIKFELIPLEDPLRIPVGGELPIQAVFEGNPLANVTLVGKDKQEIPTDQNGTGRMKITQKGIHLLMAGHKAPVQGDPEKDYDLFTTFLVFEVR